LNECFESSQPSWVWNRSAARCRVMFMASPTLL